MHRSCGIDIVRPQGLQQFVYLYIYISYTTIQYTNYTYIYIPAYVCVCTPPQKNARPHSCFIISPFPNGLISGILYPSICSPNMTHVDYVMSFAPLAHQHKSFDDV